MLHVNFSYTVQEIRADGLVLDDLEGGRAFVPTPQLCHFSFAHASTGHSQQGLTIDGAVTVFDASFSWLSDGQRCGVTANWMYTALSRVRNMSELYMFVGHLPPRPRAPATTVASPAPAGSADDAQPEVAVRQASVAQPEAFARKMIGRKIAQHKQADKRAGRTWAKGTYITVDDVQNMAARQHGRCLECGCVMQLEWAPQDHSQVSVDRIDNSKAHAKDNCRLVCLRCNKAKQ